MTLTNFLLCFIGGVMIFVQGCVTQTNLVKTGDLTIENRSPGKVKINYSRAYDVDGHLMVRGVLQRRDHVGMPIPAHVHVVELSDDNHIVQSLQTREHYVPRNKVGKGIDWIRFKVRSSTLPQVGSQLLVVVHNHKESHTDQDLLSMDF